MKKIWCILLLGVASMSALAQAQQATQQPAQGQPQAAPTPQQRVAMLKQWLAASQQQLRHYEWIETTVILMDGEEKKREQKSCYYGADGVLQKVPVGSSSAEQAGGPPGPLGRVAKRKAKHKAEEIAEYMKNASALVQSYLPPDPNKIQQAQAAGRMSINPIEPGRRTRLVFREYMKPNDSLGIDIDVQTNRLLGMSVTSYMDTPDDAVDLDVAMGVLPDGTIYTEKTTLQAPAEKITVVIENTGYRHSGT